MSESVRFRVALTADFYVGEASRVGRMRDASATKYRDIGLSRLTSASKIELTCFAEHRAEVDAEQLADANGVIVLSPRVTANSLLASDNLLAIGRFGVGYDSVDVAACTAADVALFITVGAVDYSVAEATVGWMLALTHHVRAKDRLVREARQVDRQQRHYDDGQPEALGTRVMGDQGGSGRRGAPRRAALTINV